MAASASSMPCRQTLVPGWGARRLLRNEAGCALKRLPVARLAAHLDEPSIDRTSRSGIESPQAGAAEATWSNRPPARKAKTRPICSDVMPRRCR